jgi:hypothetical protein
MSMENWDKLARPPASALKTIQGGRLKNFTDVRPQWRYQIMTEVFGQCGIGWKFEIVRMWTEQGSDGQVFAWVHVNVFTKSDDGWSSAIPGIGGDFLVEKESHGLYANDDAFKMALTDALGTALKMLGVAADVYSGLWDGSKYRDTRTERPTADTQAPRPTVAPPASSQGALWEGVNKFGKPFRSTGKELPKGWFARLKEDRNAAINELGGKGYGAEKNPTTGQFEIVELLDTPATTPPDDSPPF